MDSLIVVNQLTLKRMQQVLLAKACTARLHFGNQATVLHFVPIKLGGQAGGPAGVADWQDALQASLFGSTG